MGWGAVGKLTQAESQERLLRLHKKHYSLHTTTTGLAEAVTQFPFIHSLSKICEALLLKDTVQDQKMETATKRPRETGSVGKGALEKRTHDWWARVTRK